jgi:hypothetical protein
MAVTATAPATTQATPLALPEVTLCAADTRSPLLAWWALRRSMAGIDFARAVLFTHDWQPPSAVPGLALVDIGALRSGADYSQFVLRRLPEHIDTPFVLVTQWDGFVVDPAAWRPEFLQYDYIGAPWPDQPAERSVGNGGFSLRSQRLLRAGSDPRLGATLHPEDLVLARTRRDWVQAEHGVRFAPAALARQFAFENHPPPAGQTCFGFHGPYNLPRVLSGIELQATLAELPSEFFRSRDARRLARALLAARQPKVALELLSRRRAAGRNDPNTRLLQWVASAMQPWARPQ